MWNIKNLYKRFISLEVANKKLLNNVDEIKMLTGISLSHSAKLASTIQEAEFKVFSQWGEDGIIQYILDKIKVSNKYFIEFGVENYTEANTRFLLLKDNWSGLVFDGTKENIDYIHKDPIYWKHDLTAVHEFLTAENINQAFRSANAPTSIGILSIDVDGNDYWIWKNISSVEADIVIMEYNSFFGSDRSITIPYDAAFTRNKAHYSNLYYGSSLTSLCDLAEEKGYNLVGCNSAGNNAFFVKKEKMGNLIAQKGSNCFVNSKFREARNTLGELTFASRAAAIKEIKGMPVMNTRTNKIETL